MRPGGPCTHLSGAAPGPSRAVGRVAPDLGIGAVATRHRVLGLHQLLRLLDHLAPEASDALWGETKWVGPRGGVPCRLAVPPQPFPKVWTALSPSVPLGLRFQVCKSGYQATPQRMQRRVPVPALWTREELTTSNENGKVQSKERPWAVSHHEAATTSGDIRDHRRSRPLPESLQHHPLASGIQK